MYSVFKICGMFNSRNQENYCGCSDITMHSLLQKFHSKNYRQVGKMLDILFTKTEKDFQVFCDHLKRHGLQHLVINFLSKRGKSMR